MQLKLKMMKMKMIMKMKIKRRTIIISRKLGILTIIKEFSIELSGDDNKCFQKKTALV